MTGRAIAYGRPNGNFTIILNDFLRDPDIKPYAFRVATYVMSHDETYEMTQASIGRALGISRTTVLEAFKQLEQLGYLIRQRCADPATGHRLADDLFISQTHFTPEQIEALSLNGQHWDGQHGESGQPKEDQSNKKINTQEDQDMSGEPDASVEPAPKPSTKNDLSIEALDLDFAAWYAKYPRKEGKGQARIKYREKRRAGVTPQTLDLGVLEYVRRLERDRTAPRYIKLPATWLNGECWEDDDVVRSDAVRGGPGVVHTAKDRAEQRDWYDQVPASALLEDQ